MSSEQEAERAAYAAVDGALRSYPLRPAPPGLARAVRARLPARARAPRFRLAWLDYALSVLGACMAGLTLLLWQGVTPVMWAQFQMEMGLLLSRWQAGGGALWMALAAGGGMAALGLLAVGAVVFRRRA
jgi:hypothetical protein